MQHIQTSTSPKMHSSRCVFLLQFPHQWGSLRLWFVKPRIRRNCALGPRFCLFCFSPSANMSTQPERTPLTDHLNLLLSKLPINSAEQTFLHGTRGTRVCPVAGTIWDYRRLLVRLLVALLVAWGTTCCRGSGQPEAEAVWRLHKGAMPGLGSKQTQHVQGHTAHALLTNTE